MARLPPQKTRGGPGRGGAPRSRTNTSVSVAVVGVEVRRARVEGHEASVGRDRRQARKCVARRAQWPRAAADHRSRVRPKVAHEDVGRAARVVGVEIGGPRQERHQVPVGRDRRRVRSAVAPRASWPGGAANQCGPIPPEVAHEDVGVGVVGVFLRGVRLERDEAPAGRGRGRGGTGQRSAHPGRRVRLEVAHEDRMVKVGGPRVEGYEAPLGRDRGRRGIAPWDAGQAATHQGVLSIWTSRTKTSE